MKARQIVISIIATPFILVFSFYLMQFFAGKKKDPPTFEPPAKVVTVFADTVKTSAVPVYVESTGLLEALNRMELFSEVQGVMLPDGGRFKPGNTFQKGELLLSMRADDQQAQLVAQRSSYESLITSIMPDLRVDYPAEYPQWQSFLQSVNIQKPCPELPEVTSGKLRSFLIGRNVYSNFYTLKNLEIVVGKYQLVAPYSGVLAEATVDPGTVIRPGQNLGVFIQPGEFELQASVDAVTAELLEVGQTAHLSIEGLPAKSWTGTISRVNPAIDPTTQMSRFFVKVSSDALKDGMFMQTKVQAMAIENAFEIPRSVLFDKNQVYIVQNDRLVAWTVTPIHFSERTVVVRDLPDGFVVINKTPPGAYPGMKVSVYQANQ